MLCSQKLTGARQLLVANSLRVRTSVYSLQVLSASPPRGTAIWSWVLGEGTSDLQ